MSKLDQKRIQLPGLSRAEVVEIVFTDVVGAVANQQITRELIEDIFSWVGGLSTVGRHNLLSPFSPRLHREHSWEEIMELVKGAEKSFCYVMQNAEGRVKVGKADNPDQRRQNLATGSAGGLVLLHSVECNDGRAHEVERRAKKLLRASLIGGEWFSCSVEDATLAVDQAHAEIYGKS